MITTTITIVGFIFLIVGCIATIVGDLMFLVIAYKRGLLWFFGCLFVPPVCWLFLLLNIKAAIKPFAIQVIGFLLACLGAYMTGIP